MHANLKQNLAHNTIQFKGGLYTLTTLNILDNNLFLLDGQLKEKISQAPMFFHNAPIIADLKIINTKELVIDLAELKTLLLKNNFILVALQNATAEQRATAETLGLAILRATSQEKTSLEVKPAITHETADLPTNKSLIISHPVRSGEQVFAAHGDLIVVASVSNGAELLAEGNIHIYGTLRGRALAGINGNQDARIFCKNLEAELVSIAGEYQISEDIEKQAWKVPAMISIKEGRLQISEI